MRIFGFIFKSWYFYINTLLSFLLLFLFLRVSFSLQEGYGPYLLSGAFLLIVLLLNAYLQGEEGRWVTQKAKVSFFREILSWDESAFKGRSESLVNDMNRNLSSLLLTWIGLIRGGLRLLMLCLLLGVMGRYSPVLMYTALGGVLILLLANLAIGFYQRKLRREEIDLNRDWTGRIWDLYRGKDSIAVYQKGGWFNLRYGETLSKLARNFAATTTLGAFNQVYLQAANLLLPVLIFTLPGSSQAPFPLLLIYFLSRNLMGSAAAFLRQLFNLKPLLDKMEIIHQLPPPAGLRRLTAGCPSVRVEDFRLPSDQRRTFDFQVPGLYWLEGKVGVGKTTLLKAIKGVDLSYRGTVHLRGLGEEDICFVPQEVFIYPGSLTENLLFSQGEGAQLTRQQLQRVEFYGLSHLFQRESLSSTELSGGEKKRVSFLRWLFYHREVNLLDEIFSEVGEDYRRKMVQDIKATNSLCIVVSHVPFDAEGFERIGL